MRTKKINEKKLKELIWKYFWKQKLFEIGIVFGIIFILLILPFLIGYASCYINPKFTQDLGKFEGIFDNPVCFSNFWTTYYLGWIIITTLLLGFTVGFFIILVISKWIYNNWKKAKEKAREELQNV